ncbi:hypothetical protein V8J88_14230 [Massilia sp. W12]|uniref:hypothetical protein n=1 Tax=Massilia sp. W12 TaxID=3126507 RepID=UPI0030CC224C
MQTISVKAALAQLDVLAGQDVTLEGILHFAFERIALEHYPLSESAGHSSSLSLWTGAGSLGFDVEACRKLNGKRVLAQGTLSGPDPRLGGCGHMSAYPAELLLRYLTKWPQQV